MTKSSITLDTSALIAILQDEPGRASFIALVCASRARISAVSYTEAMIVLSARRGPVAMTVLQHFVARAGISVEPLDTDLAERAARAWSVWGRGRRAAAGPTPRRARAVSDAERPSAAATPTPTPQSE